MRHCTFVLALALALSASSSQGQEIHHLRTGKVSDETKNLLPPVTSLRAILDVLNQAKLSGSLVFSGTCKLINYGEFSETPSLRATARKDGPPVHTLRRMFGNHPEIRVTQGTNGIVRMQGRNAPTDVLDLKIAHLSFDRREGGADNANAALLIIGESPEFQHFLKARRCQSPMFSRPISILADKNGKITPTPSYIPHISGSMNNVTVREALDRILKVFPGLWVYENCPRAGTRERTVYFRFFRLDDTGNGTIVE